MFAKASVVSAESPMSHPSRGCDSARRSADERDAGPGALLRRFPDYAGLGQPGIGEDPVQEGQDSRGEERQAHLPRPERCRKPSRRERRECAADERPEDESESKGRSNESHPFGAFLGFRHIGNHGLGGAQVRTGDPGQDARERKPGQGARESHEHVRNEPPGDADQEDRPPADSIAQSSPQVARRETASASSWPRSPSPGTE